MPQQSRRRIFFALVLTLSLLVFAAIDTFACTCRGPRSGKNSQPCGVFWNSDVVFVGTAESVSIERIGEGEQSYGRMFARLSVERAVRGVKVGEIIEFETNPDSASCGYPFRQGEKYFVYTSRRGEKNGRLSASLCNPIIPLKNAEIDLEYLNAIENGERGTRAYGTIYDWRRASFKEPDKYAPLAGIQITLKGKKKTFKTSTDDEGFYMFREVPDDTYEVKVNAPPGLREFVPPNASLYRERTIVIGDKSTPVFPSGKSVEKLYCGEQSFTFTAQARIEGKIVSGDSGITPAPQQFLSLMAVDETGKPVLDYPVKSLWADKMTGDFYFDPVPPGKYLLSINPQNCPSTDPRQSEFGQVFFPGVKSAGEAKIITVGTGERLKIGNFRLPAPLKERIFSGVVLNTAGNPVSGARVFILDDGNAASRCRTYSSLAEAKTDEAGRFSIKGLEGYTYAIRAYIETNGRNSPRLFSKMVDINAKGNVENLELILSDSY